MPVSIQFLGVGGAFSMPTVPGDLSKASMQSNMVITSASGKRMLFDCGSDIRFSAQMCGYGPNSFDAVYISHEHDDHTGGLEWLLLNRLFAGGLKPVLIAEAKLTQNLWKMLRPGLRVTTKGVMKFSDYVIDSSTHYSEWLDAGMMWWDGLKLTLKRQVHVPHKSRPMISYGLTVWDGDSATFHVSSDATFDAEGITEVAEHVSVIFHDC